MPLALTQAEANAKAYALACKRAEQHKLCYGTDSALPTACVGVAYSVSLVVAGGQKPLTYAITGGTLPAGLTLNGLTGTISGTATGPVSTTVTIKATDQIGSTMTKTFTVKAIELVSPATLPGATVGAAYSYQMLVAGTSVGLVWNVTSGALPTGLTMTNVGLISGTPTVAGTATFTVSLQDSSGAFCEKEFTLVAAAGTPTALSYWTFDTYAGVNVVDSTGNGHSLTGGGPGFTLAVPGIVANGIEILGNFDILAINVGVSNPAVDGFTFCGWCKTVQLDDPGGGVVIEYLAHQFVLTWDSGGGGLLSEYTVGVPEAPYDSMAYPQDGQWHFVRFWLDPVTTRLNLQIDMGAVLSTVPLTVTADVGPSTVRLSGTAVILGTNRAFDEVGVWKRVLSNAEATALYNAGAGRTWPNVP